MVYGAVAAKGSDQYRRAFFSTRICAHTYAFPINRILGCSQDHDSATEARPKERLVGVGPRKLRQQRS
jgi:hypothetical protein